MKSCIYFVLLLVFFPPDLLSQVTSETGDTLFNQVDEKGLKQGFWKKYYENGIVRYTGQFIDDQPVGTFRRYYDDQSIQSVMEYRKDQNVAFTTFYYQDGTRAAEGKYVGNFKDSTWNYYSYYGGFLSYREQYQNGIKNGTSLKYFADGSPSEVMEWKNGKKHGSWKQWYPNGTLKMETTFQEDQIHGLFTVFNLDGQKEIEGRYDHNLKTGNWIIFNAQSKEPKQIKFIGGIPENQEEIDKKFTETMDQYEKQKGSIPEPDLNNFIIDKRK